MTDFSIYGTLLTREEAKKIRGGSTSAYCTSDSDCPGGSMCYGGVCAGGSCPTSPADCHGQACTFTDPMGNPRTGKCNTDEWVPDFCACVANKLN